MESKLNNVSVWPGVILSVSSTGFFGWLIRSALGKAYAALTGDKKENCPTHNGIIVEYDGRLWVGDCIHPQARLTPFFQYEQDFLNKKIHNLQLFEAHEIGKMRQEMAAEWWVKRVLGAKYDWPAFFRLSLKAIFGDWLPWAAGSPFKWYCVEGIKDAYKIEACWDFYSNENPTPFTTVKRWKEGRLKLLEAK